MRDIMKYLEPNRPINGWQYTAKRRECKESEMSMTIAAIARLRPYI